MQPKDEGTRILETRPGVAASETGIEVETPKAQRDKGRRALLQAKISTGDTLVLKGKLASGLTYETIATFDGTADYPLFQAVDIPPYVQASRSVDGDVGEAELWIDVF